MTAPATRPTDLIAAVEQMYAALAEFEAAQQLVLDTAAAKFDAGVRVDFEKPLAIERLVASGLTKTDAKARYAEDPEYAALDRAYCTAARLANVAEANLAIARRRHDTAQACVNALTPWV